MGRNGAEKARKFRFCLKCFDCPRARILSTRPEGRRFCCGREDKARKDSTTSAFRILLYWEKRIVCRERLRRLSLGCVKAACEGC